MEDLVRVGVPDAAENAGIGQGALQRVVVAEEPFGECREARVEHLDAARVVALQLVGAAHDVDRGLASRACLGQDQRAVRKVERRKTDLAGNRRATFAPAQPSSDHQVEHEEQLVAETENEAFSQSVQVGDRPPLESGGRRVDGADDERVAEADALERAIANARTERLQIELDVR